LCVSFPLRSTRCADLCSVSTNVGIATNSCIKTTFLCILESRQYFKLFCTAFLSLICSFRSTKCILARLSVHTCISGSPFYSQCHTEYNVQQLQTSPAIYILLLPSTSTSCAPLSEETSGTPYSFCVTAAFLLSYHLFSTLNIDTRSVASCARSNVRRSVSSYPSCHRKQSLTCFCCVLGYPESAPHLHIQPCHKRDPNP